MGDPTLGNYKSSTLLRSLCFFGLGYEICNMISNKSIAIESLVFLVVYAGGIFLSKAKNAMQMKVFAGLVLLMGLLRAVFQFDNFSGTRPGVGVTVRNGYTGIEHITLFDGIQLILSFVLVYLSYNIFK